MPPVLSVGEGDSIDAVVPRPKQAPRGLVLSVGEGDSIDVYDADGNPLRITAKRFDRRRNPLRIDLVFTDPPRNFVVTLAKEPKP